ncbi:Cryparin [Cladobotryum mycophilum]|uniref:Cryparin n=1 Tax=Cladobotryum mycophilum TaxID=491253 RepID=A0ABR0SUE1_9HYPO
MQFSTVAALLFSTFVAAYSSSYQPCESGLQSSPMCCATYVVGAASLDCGNVPETPFNAKHFQEICVSTGKQAVCCSIPVAGQALACKIPVGVQA